MRPAQIGSSSKSVLSMATSKLGELVEIREAESERALPAVDVSINAVVIWLGLAESWEWNE